MCALNRARAEKGNVMAASEEVPPPVTAPSFPLISVRLGGYREGN